MRTLHNMHRTSKHYHPSSCACAPPTSRCALRFIILPIPKNQNRNMIVSSPFKQMRISALHQRLSRCSNAFRSSIATADAPTIGSRARFLSATSMSSSIANVSTSKTQIRPQLERQFSSSAASKDASASSSPLLLWSKAETDDDSADSPLLLYDKELLPTKTIVTSPEDVVTAVNEYYIGADSDAHIGSMGENDVGVHWGSGSSGDVFNNLDLLQDSIGRVKEIRHGVPFHILTSGVVAAGVDSSGSMAQDIKNISGISTVIVSLYAGNPSDYKAAASSDNFGTALMFITECAEMGIPIEVAVVSKYNNRDTRDMIMSRQIHTY